MKYLGLVILIVVAIVVGYNLQSPQLVETNSAQNPPAAKQSPAAPTQSSLTTKHDHNHDHSNSTATSGNAQPPAPGKTGNPHFDQLSPEMQQAVKDSLLLEGPMETHKRPDGTIVLPANGRFTQMPVAVQMPDGSIQIREYSVVPKPAVPASK
ncbi:MAG: hypothetical protein HWE18_13715 [Gammaproteobacteria bacterium]|nr:hypothetical protein [Gammaproteobacteria bacterium]